MNREVRVPAPAFEYTVLIAAAPSQVWAALTTAAQTEQFWFGRCVESDWRPGSPVTIWADTARKTLDVTGEILQAEAPRLLSYTFQAYPGGEVLRERPSRVVFRLAALGELTHLTLTHDELEADSPVLAGIKRGWPAILSSLKSLLERGAPLAFPTAAQGGPAATWPA
jgi:uncharacterized protein YndB with AHSA1/START domain